MAEIIEPRNLRGFRDSLPDTESRKLEIQEKLTAVFRSFGFVPIDTPAMEYAEILLGKGGGETDKQVYRFLDHGQRDVALRFDLTVPFARFMAAHYHQLPLPFKRYHMAKVWRGENTQRGRYREFIQIDFDIVAVDSTSADFEIMTVMAESMRALGIEAFRVHFSHRQLFNELLETMDLAGEYLPVLRTIDKLKKIGAAEVEAQLEKRIGEQPARKILDFIIPEDTNRQTLEKLSSALPQDSPAVARLQSILGCIEECSLDTLLLLDPSITRGLDYYTGVVFETFLNEAADIGSVCSGGRYNDLASLYTKEKLPGVGASIGLDRLVSALEDLQVPGSQKTAPDVLILLLDEPLLGIYHNLGRSLRSSGVSAEIYPSTKKIAAQLRYAEKRGIPLAIFFGQNEMEKNIYNLRDLRLRQNYDNLTFQDLLERISALLHPPQDR
ncbi:MAG: histidine--tRNA ligase [Spirochaetaceae bacterium]|nr:MAG: histidine--tRNA ligase [Spirochaetaceae bacterium]